MLKLVSLCFAFVWSSAGFAGVVELVDDSGSVLRLAAPAQRIASLAPVVGVEDVLAADPEVIIASGADAARPPWLDAWRRWPRLTALKRDNLYFVDPDLVQRQTPRLLDGAAQICADLEAARAKRSPAGSIK